MPGARDNPFRTEAVLAYRTRLTGTTWPELIRRLQTLGGRGAIIGPHGSGKTTLLEDLGQCLAKSGHRIRHLRTDNRRRLTRRDLADIAPGECILVDVSLWEEFDVPQWCRLLAATHRRAGALVATTHHLSPLPTLYRCRPTPRLLHDMIATLLGRPAGAIDPAVTNALFRRHRGNIRTALRECYDRWEAGERFATLTPKA